MPVQLDSMYVWVVDSSVKLVVTGIILTKRNVGKDWIQAQNFWACR